MGISDYEKQNIDLIKQKMAANKYFNTREADALLDIAEKERHAAWKLNQNTRLGVKVLLLCLCASVSAWVLTLQNLAEAQRACITTLQRSD